MAGPTTTSSPTPAPAADGQMFDNALRGYERRQVDDFVARKDREIAKVKTELADARHQQRLAVEHADATEQEMREVRARSAHLEPAVPEDGFGFRAEKLLRMAEQEAAEVRTHASRESAAIIEKARNEAEQHRHEVEQALISRASLLEQQAAQRTAELQEREQQIAEQLAAARDQAEQLHASATRAADRLRKESEAAAEDTRIRAEATAQRQRDQAAQEIARLTGLQSDVRAELARLAEVLAAELSGARPTAPARRGASSGVEETEVTVAPSGTDSNRRRA